MNADDLYNLTKLTGERLCLSSGKNVKIVRLSNVVGENDTSNNFLYSIINDVKKNSNLELQQSLVSSKDYIYIDDAVDVIMKIALEGKDVIYNVASGVNTSNEEILNELQKHFLFTYTVAQNPFSIIFPTISNQKIFQEFKYNSSNILNKISLIAQKK
jgi:nucleoside-diphosphate-sugar epimerase